MLKTPGVEASYLLLTFTYKSEQRSCRATLPQAGALSPAPRRAPAPAPRAIPPSAPRAWCIRLRENNNFQRGKKGVRVWVLILLRRRQGRSACWWFTGEIALRECFLFLSSLYVPHFMPAILCLQWESSLLKETLIDSPVFMDFWSGILKLDF